MKVLVMGAGGIGGYFGARFAEVGHEVVFVARGRHKEAIERHGLTVRSKLGDALIKPAAVTEDPATAGRCDVVMVTTKLWDLEAAARESRASVGPNTAVMGPQNGVDKEHMLFEALGSAPVVGAVAFIAVTVAEPGVIEHTGEMARLVYGEMDGSVSDRIRSLQEAADAAHGFEAQVSNDIVLEIWKKFSFFAPFAGITCYHRQSIGHIREDRSKRTELEALVGEATSVARAAGVAFSSNREDEIMSFIDALPFDMKSSTLHDLEAGKRTELDWLTGAVARLGREHGVATPMTEKIHRALEPYKNGRAEP